MKIGIFTFHRSINYGAVLQAYALKNVITNLGGLCDIIDYKNQHIEEINKVRLFNFKNVKSFINSLILYPINRKKAEKFVRFRSKHLKPCDIDINEDLQNQYDVFITGSDQVWNYGLSKFDKTYFLDFVKDSKKKNSYAASFGFSCIPNEYVEEYKKLLKSYNKISVREKQGADIIQDLLDEKVPVVLDPSLLLDMSEWENAFDLSVRTSKKYILLYLMISEPTILRFTEQLSQATGCQIIYVTSKIKRTINATYIRTASPEEWLELFMNATYIVTNSFHGVAFSINFNKNFFMGLLPALANVNSRLEDIIRLFDLEERQIKEDMKIDYFKDINYKKVNNILSQERNKSIAFLNSILGEFYESD